MSILRLLSRLLQESKLRTLSRIGMNGQQAPTQWTWMATTKYSSLLLRLTGASLIRTRVDSLNLNQKIRKVSSAKLAPKLQQTQAMAVYNKKLNWKWIRTSGTSTHISTLSRSSNLIKSLQTRIHKWGWMLKERGRVVLTNPCNPAISTGARDNKDPLIFITQAQLINPCIIIPLKLKISWADLGKIIA